MAQFNNKVPEYRPSKDILFDWRSFRKGLNTLLQDTEIDKEELARADNLILTGRGIPTKRWGSLIYYQAGNVTGSVRGLSGFYPSGVTGTIELLAITDDGFLTKKSGASYARINGASWASGNNAYMAQLDNKVYIVNGQRELVRYSSPTLVGFPTIAVPTITGATNLSNATGPTVKGYKITSLSNVGETLASSTFELRSQPNTLGGSAGGMIRLFITPSSTASGVLQGINVYGRDSGSERFIGFLAGNATIFDDTGLSIPKEFTFAPTADSTGGPNAQYITRFQDRLIFAGFRAEPTKVLISGRWPNHEKFDLAIGGNYILVEPDAGDNIIQIIGFADRVIILKEKSIWQMTLSTEQIGNFFVTIPQLKLITSSYGCIAPKSVVAVDNDIFFLTRQGVFSLGYQSGFAIDTLRTNEISARIGPYFDNLSISQLKNAVATYAKGMYIIGFPEKNEMMVLDRQRLAWTGPWNLDTTVFETFYDSDGVEHLLFAPFNTVNVNEFSESLDDDSGTAFTTTLRTRSEDFGDWSIFKNIKSVFTEMRNVSGTVTVEIRIEQRNGSITTVKTYTVTSSFSGNSGWGADMFGNTMWGNSDSIPSSVEATFEIKWSNLNKIGRTVQLIVKTSVAADNYELLGVRGLAKPLSQGFSPSSWRT